MAYALVIGNLVRGFTVITGFASEDLAHSFVAENRKLVGSEYRLAPAVDHSSAVPVRQETELQDPLVYEPQQPGEVLLAGGVSLDVIDHKEQPHAEHSGPAAEVGAGAATPGPREPGDDAAVSGVPGTGGSVSGDGEGENLPD